MMGPATPYLVGVGLALAVAAAAGVFGLDRERSFYPTVLIVVASYYDLFAAIGGLPGALGAETVLAAAFVLAALIGFRFSLWIVAAALALHGMLDLVHGGLVANRGVPPWWPPFCMAYDITAAAWLAWRLIGRQRIDPRRQPFTDDLKITGGRHAGPFNADQG